MKAIFLLIVSEVRNSQEQCQKVTRGVCMIRREVIQFYNTTLHT